MLKPILLLAVFFVFGVSNAQNTPVPLYPIYSQNWIQTQFNRTLYLEHTNEVRLPQNHSSEYSYVGENCELTLVKNKLNVRVHRVGEAKIYQVHNKEKKKTDSLSFVVLAYPQPKIYWGYSTNRFTDEGEIIPLQTDASNIKLVMPSALNDSYKIISWKIKIKNEYFDFTKDLIPEFLHYKIFTQKGKVVACPIEVKCESKKRGKLTISDTLFIANRYSLGNSETQKITVIERNESNFSALFDMNNGLSLMSLIANNSFKNVNFIVPDALKRNQNIFNYSHNYRFLGLDSDDPMLDIFGNDSMDFNGNYVYPPREILYFDIEEITHIVIVREFNTLNNTIDGINTRIILAKKINGSEKLELVFSTNFTDLTHQIIGTTFYPVPKNRLHLIWDENFEIVKELRACRDKINRNLSKIKSKDLNDLCPGIHYLPNLWDSKIMNQEFDYYRINATVDLLNFNNNFSAYYNYKDTELFEVGKVSILDEYACFNDYNSMSTRYAFHENGMYHELKDENGRLRWFYNSSAFFYAFSKNVNAYQVMQYNDNRDSLITNHMFFTIDYKGFEIPYLLFTLPETSDFNFIRNFNAIPISKLPWKLELENALSDSKVYDPNNTEDLKELDALFYLDSFDGKPLNMLNVCLGCD